MQRYFALLRGINVGGHRIKMDRLRELIEALGFAQVETFIASGNVIFSSPSQDVRAMEERIARHLHEALGYEVTTLIRTQSELDSIAAFEPSDPAPADQSVYGSSCRKPLAPSSGKLWRVSAPMRTASNSPVERHTGSYVGSSASHHSSAWVWPR